MNLTTSTISHEMRNPLNSIISQTQIQESNIDDLSIFISKVKHKLTASEVKEVEGIRDKMKESNQTQKTSS